MQLSLSHLKNIWRLFTRLHWTLIKYLSFGIHFFLIQKQCTVTEEIWESASKATIIPFSIFTPMFHQRFMEHRFLESTLELLQQFYLQVESIAHDYKVFPGDQSKFCLKCLCCEKNNPYRINWKTSIHCIHGYLSSSENIVVNPSCQWFTFNFQEYASPFRPHKKIFSIKNIVWQCNLWNSWRWRGWTIPLKINCTSHDCRIGEYCFLWGNQSWFGRIRR